MRSQSKHATQPTVSIIIPSIGYPTLAATIRSIKRQRLIPGDEVLVVGDGPQLASKELVDQAGPPFVYVEGPQTRQWGNAQRNVGLDRARGQYIVWMDEDDVFTRGALAAIRRTAIANPGRPMMFRFFTASGRLLWEEKVAKMGFIGGHQFVAPNEPGKIGRWGLRYEGDFDFIDSTLALHPADAVIWSRRIIARSRPHVKQPLRDRVLASARRARDRIRRRRG